MKIYSFKQIFYKNIFHKKATGRTARRLPVETVCVNAVQPVEPLCYRTCQLARLSLILSINQRR